MKKILIGISIVLLINNVLAENKVNNNTASCDSTCMVNAGSVSEMSGLQQRVIACVSGFSGTKLQTRTKSAVGGWSEWIDKNIDNCNCVPTTKYQASTCDEPLKGTKEEKSDWTCTSPKSGVWSDWKASSNGCYTPCQALPDEKQTVSCGSGYTGTMTQTRTSSCSGDDSKPPIWSEWNTISSNCVKVPVCVRTEEVIDKTYRHNQDCDGASGEVFFGYWVYADGTLMNKPNIACMKKSIQCAEYK